MKRIIKVEVQNSDFFTTGFQLDLSDHLNCVMGGRGTGKSTILHFVKSCLEPDAEEDKNTFGVLKSNLGSGIIKLYIQSENGETYRIEKTFGEIPQPYLASSGRHIPIETINKEVMCDIFPAQMIEEIGRNSEARLELIDKMLVGEIEDLKEQIDFIRMELEKNAKDIRSHNQKLKKNQDQLEEYKSAEDDLNQHKADPPDDVREDEKQEFERQDAAEKIRAAETRYLKSLADRFSGHLTNYTDLTEDLQQTMAITGNIDRFINKPLIESYSKQIEQSLLSVQTSNAASRVSLSACINLINEAAEKLKVQHEQQHNIFVQLKQKLDKHKVYFDKLNLLSKRVDEKNVRLKEIEELTNKRKRLKLHREADIVKLNKVKNEILDGRLKKISALNQLFEGRIKITLTPGGITDEYENALRNALKGNYMRYNTIIPYIVNNFSPDKFAKVIHENDAETLKSISSIDIERSKAILSALHETDAIYEIETIYCPDLPDFHLKIDKAKEVDVKTKENYRKSDELSTGQRCTTVLPIIFAISKNPLIIDQPEDNLDNEYISKTIHKIIIEQKKERQLIFITHNANIPVLSNAEKNVFLNYNEKKSSKSVEGNVNEVKGSILELLEGGEDAFRERMKLYNY
jgi:ABC-type lipoprotein export system ATPase subunit